MSEFVENYINNCLEEGISGFAEIATKAKGRISEIDKILETMADLRKEKVNLLEVVKSIEPEKKAQQNQAIAEIPQIDELSAKICKEIEAYQAPILPRFLLEKIGYATVDPTPAYMAIKSLLDKEIICRAEDRKLYLGPNWSKE